MAAIFTGSVMVLDMMTLLAGLFLSAFLSATLLPGSSEVFLAGILSQNSAPVGLAVFVATVGNTAGSCVNWYIGRFFAHFRYHRRFPVNPGQYEQYSSWYRRWGIWSLLLSWVPVIGDPLTVIAGAARTPIVLFTGIVFVAKGVRYLFVAGLVGFFW